MPHYIAFLRGINLGNRRIKMDVLRELFEELKLREVTTFIASGNVLFSSQTTDSEALENVIEKHLEKSLGYAVDTYVRTRVELAAAATFQPFSQAELTAPTNTLHVGFLKQALSPVAKRALLACKTEVDDFSVNGREYYWLCRIKSHESKVWTSPLMKAAKLPSATMRNMKTIQKLTTAYPA